MIIAIKEKSDIIIPIISHFIMEILHLTNYFYLFMNKKKISKLIVCLEKCLIESENTGYG